MSSTSLRSAPFLFALLALSGCPRNKSVPSDAQPSARAMVDADAPKTHGPWRIENPTPTGAALSAVWGSSPSDLYAVGSGVLLHSVDGDTWKVIERGEPWADATAIWGSSASDIYVCGSKGILHTSDAGKAWAPATVSEPLESTGCNAVWGSSASDVYVAGTSGISHSTDGGKTWIDVEKPAGFFRAIWGTSANDVFVAGSEPGAKPFNPFLIVHSGNGGRSWQAAKRGAVANINSVAGDEKAIVAVGDFGLIVRSTNGGRAWQVSKLAAEDDLLNAVAFGSGEIIIASASGRTLRSTDAGKTWAPKETGITRPESGSESMLNGLFAIGDSMYAVGYGGTILRSRGGAAWTPVAGSKIKTGLKAVWGSDSANVFAVGDDGAIAHSTDRGITWRASSTGSKSTLTGIWGSSASDIYVVGRNATSGPVILHSSDGTSWQSLKTDAFSQKEELVGVWGTDANDVYVVGLHHVMRSSDHGQSFEVVYTDDGSQFSGVFGRGGAKVPKEIYVSGSIKSAMVKQGDLPSLLVRSIDSGKTWSSVSANLPVNGSRAWVSNDGLVFTGGYGPIIHRSASDGKRWMEQPISFDGYLNAITGNAHEVFAVGFNGALLSTSDDGATWQAQDVGVDHSLALYGVWASADGDVFAVGDAGLILHRRD